MSEILISALSVGVLSWLWAVLSGKLALITWVGFIGCTSYYASGSNLKKSVICNISGVFWAMVVILGAKYIDYPRVPAILTGIFSFAMCYQAKCKKLSFIPGTFMGACSTFGSSGDYKLVIISLLCGSLVGFFSDLAGKYIFLKYVKKY